MEAIFAYLAFSAGAITFSNKSSFSPEKIITEKAESKEYQRNSSIARSTTNALIKVANINGYDLNWANYFWNKGLTIDGCQKQSSSWR